MAQHTPAKRLHALAHKHGVIIEEFSPGLRVWTIRDPNKPRHAEPLAFGVPHSRLADKIRELSLTEQEKQIAARFAESVQAMFESESQWSVLDLDGAQEFFDSIGFQPSESAVSTDD